VFHDLSIVLLTAHRSQLFEQLQPQIAVISQLCDTILLNSSSQVTDTDVRHGAFFSSLCYYVSICPHSWNVFCQILDNCKAKPLFVKPKLENPKIAPVVRKMLKIYDLISGPKKERDLALAQALDLASNDKKTEGYYFLAKYFFTSADSCLECYYRIRKTSIFAERASLQAARLLASGEIDVRGRSIQLLAADARPYAIIRAFEEALKHVISPISPEQLTVEYRELKRTLIGALLATPVNAQKQAFLEEETDFSMLLHRITEYKFADQLASMQANLAALQQKVETLSLTDGQ
jgi:hypothetical protein